MVEGLVVAFSGRIASGKSTLSREVALALGLPRVSFGDYVRTIAQSKGLPETRENLQTLGESLVASDTLGFCRAVVAQASFTAGESLIVDGVRHLEVLRTLRGICEPSVVRLVLLEVDDEIRRVRSGERGIQDNISTADVHSTEEQVAHALKNEADLVLNGRLPVEELLAIVTRYARTGWRTT